MFCDLVGSTRLAKGLDPEDWAEALGGYHAICRETVESHGGHVAQYLGDGVLAYFGYPRAGENDPEMAARAGLDVLGRLERRNRSLATGGIELAARIGLHTGPVVVDTVGGEASGERLALGDTPNIAAHLQGAAAPDTLLASEASYGLLRGHFVIDRLDDVRVKNEPEPITAYRIVRPSGVSSRFTAASGMDPTRLVGRDAELLVLRELWTRAQSGEGHCLLLSGEAGIGKSRLIEAFRLGLESRQETVNWVASACVARLQGSALAPMIDIVRRSIGANGEDPVLDAQRLVTSLETVGLDPESAAPLLCPVLSLPVPEGEGYALALMSPQRQRQRTLEVLIEWILRASALRPIVLVVDDIQFADPSTLELLAMLIERTAGASLLAIFAHRTDFELVNAWASQDTVSSLPLVRLSGADTRILVEAVLRDRGGQDQLVESVVARADGVPLFAEELTKMLAESEGMADEEVPMTLQDSLMARLDRLGSVKEVAQLGSVIGREFSFELLAALSKFDDERLRASLDELVAAELVYPIDEESYVFKHALVQDVAYQSLLKSRRRVLHRLLADVLTDHRAKGHIVDPAILAHHLTEAHAYAEAIAEWQQAAQVASNAFAQTEAEKHIARGREYLSRVEDGSERDRLELGLHLAHMNLHQVVHGPAADGIGDVLDEAHSLAVEIGAKDRIFMVTLYGAGYLLSREDVADGGRLAQEALDVAEEIGAEPLRVAALTIVSTAELSLGGYAETARLCEEGLLLHEPPGLLGAGVDPEAILRMNLGTARWCLGQPEQGLAAASEGVVLHWDGSGVPPVTVGWLLTYITWMHILQGELSEARRSIESVLACAEEGGHDILSAFGRCWLACTRLCEKVEPAAVAELEEALANLDQLGPTPSYQEAVLALAYAQLGDFERSDALFDEIEADIEARHQGHATEEILRLRAERLLLDAQDRSAQAEGYLRDSIELARSRAALGWELRSTLTLAELLRDTGRREQARRELEAVYVRIDEGHGAGDLARASAILRDLAG